jgi:hypothetical protein
VPATPANRARWLVFFAAWRSRSLLIMFGRLLGMRIDRRVGS